MNSRIRRRQIRAGTYRPYHRQLDAVTYANLQYLLTEASEEMLDFAGAPKEPKARRKWILEE